MIFKKFQDWCSLKEKTDNSQRVHFRLGDIWFARVGENIGFEQCGKGNKFLRPVLVLKKFNNEIFLGVPLSKTKKVGKYYFGFSYIDGIESRAVLSQIRLFDSKRLEYKSGGVSDSLLKEIIEKTKNMLD